MTQNTKIRCNRAQRDLVFWPSFAKISAQKSYPSPPKRRSTSLLQHGVSRTYNNVLAPLQLDVVDASLRSLAIDALLPVARAGGAAPERLSLSAIAHALVV